MVLIVAFAGAIAGLAVGLLTATHVEIAGTEASVRIHPGRSYDQLELNSLLTATRKSGRSVVGEPVGITVRLKLDAGTFTNRDGSFNTDVLPVYVQAYSDPDQIATDVRWAITKHLLWFVSLGAAAGLAVVVGRLGYRRWRRKLDAAAGADPRIRRVAIAYRAPERALARKVAIVIGAFVVLTVIPSGVPHPEPAARITPDPLLTNTPLAGTQLTGLLRPAIDTIKNYVQTYFADTNTYYDQLRDKLRAYLDAQAITLPSGNDIVQVGFVTDRHCNIGMDRVIVAFLQHFDVKILVSGGDDDFSGSFAFESVCTKNLAEKSQQAGVTDVFVAGNHDSATTIVDERRQHIKVLDDSLVEVGGLTFAGEHDPRSSRYGEGIKPDSAEVRLQLLTAQGRRIGQLACTAQRPVIVVLHDPRAGLEALHDGCGKAVTALDGHTHKRAGPDVVALPDGNTGSQFVGGSSGGAPGEGAVESTFASRLTVGPLNHQASLNIVSIDRTTGVIAGVTECVFSPAQDITCTIS